MIRLSEFDVTQKIIEAVAGVCSRAVLFSVKERPKSAAQIADELDLSLSAVYKNLSVLEALTLVVVEQFTITGIGKKIKMYRSRISKVEITVEGTEPVLLLYPCE